MDKETLSNYGWIVIAVLVLSVMIALATPFGTYIKTGVENAATGLVETSNKGINVALLSTGTPKPYVPIVRNGIIPDGCIYTPNGGTSLVGNGTNTFPNTVQMGDTYEEGDYTYKYNKYYSYSSWSSNLSQNGWGVIVKDTSKTEYSEILFEIAGKPVNTMSQTFAYCRSLTTAPAIPNSVTNMSYTFEHCNSLITAPVIPNGITNMQATFADCTSITTAPTIPNSVTNMWSTFQGCTSLTTAPTIPNSITNMQATFIGCTSLTTAPTIPSGVTNMWSTFQGCTSLIGTIEVNANPTNYSNCLKSTQITGITGSCSQETKDALIATK